MVKMLTYMIEDESERKLLTVKLDKETIADFQISAKSRGATMSSLVHQFVLKTIREEKERFPQKFPDYAPPPVIVRDENEINKIVYEAFEGREVDPDTLRAMLKTIKELLEVREIGPNSTVKKIENG